MKAVFVSDTIPQMAAGLSEHNYAHECYQMRFVIDSYIEGYEKALEHSIFAWGNK